MSGKKSSASVVKKRPVVTRSAPKNLIASLPYKIIRGGVSEAY
jgi:hypothetical protein